MRYIVLAFLFAAVIAAAGFLALSQKRGPQTTSDQTPPPSIAYTTPQTDTPPLVITDEAGLLTLSLPADWTVMKEGAQGVRLSGIQAESSDFSLRNDEQAEGPFTPTYYETGSHLQVSIQNGIRPQTDRPAGEILEEKKVKVDGIEADYFRYKEPSTLQGEILDVRFSTDDKSYFFRFGYNPDTLPNGQNTFFTIIKSVELLN